MTSRGARGKKVVNQDELRRLMRERKQSSARQTRVDSPHARYSAGGALSCALCNVPVKSDILWQAHVLGRQHKEKVAEVKGGKQRAEGPNQNQNQTQTRTQEPSAPKRKTEQTEHAHEKKRVKSGGAPAAGLSAGLGLLAGHYDDEDEEEEGEKKNEATDSTSDSKQPGGSLGLPTDFFDSSIPGTAAASHSGSVSKADDEKLVEKKDNMSEVLPEGFFDDPVRDAKVRNVDTPKDHMDKEWEEFQKELRQVSNASEAIVAEEDEEGRIGRQIDEIDEQIECLRRVEALRCKQDAVKDRVRVKRMEEQQHVSGSEDEEDEEEELLHVLGRDWRAKGALV